MACNKDFILTNSVAFSPQVNSTNWAATTGQRILMSAFADRGMLRGQHDGTPTAVNLSLLEQSCYFFFQVAPHLYSRGWVDPVQGPLLLRKTGSIRNRAQDLWVCSQDLWTLNHRGSWGLHYWDKNCWNTFQLFLHIMNILYDTHF
jgi:hypothetical protein